MPSPSPSRFPDAPASPVAFRTATCVATLLAIVGVAASLGAIAAPADTPDWKLSGDLRAGYFASERTARDGAHSDDDAFNARLRVAIEHAFNGRWRVRTRLAGRFSSRQDGSNLYLRGYAPSRTGAAFGDVTLDEAYLGIRRPIDECGCGQAASRPGSRCRGKRPRPGPQRQPQHRHQLDRRRARGPAGRRRLARPRHRPVPAPQGQRRRRPRTDGLQRSRQPGHAVPRPREQAAAGPDHPTHAVGALDARQPRRPWLHHSPRIT